MEGEEPNLMQNPILAEEAIPTQEGADPTCSQESTEDDALDNGWQWNNDDLSFTDNEIEVLPIADDEIVVLPFVDDEIEVVEQNFDFQIDDTTHEDCLHNHELNIFESTMMGASSTLDSSYVCEESFEKTKKRDWRKLKYMDRKRARLQNIVEDLSSPVKAKVV